MLRQYISPTQDDWEDRLPHALFVINNAWNESVQNTPFFLNYGKHPRVPYAVKQPRTAEESVHDMVQRIKQAVDYAKVCLGEAQNRQKRYADRGRREQTYAVGDQVWLNTKNHRAPGCGQQEVASQVCETFSSQGEDWRSGLKTAVA